MVLLVAVACTPVPGETVEVYEAAYAGELVQKDLAPDITILEEGTALSVALYEDADVLWADVTFTGKIAQGILVLAGPQDDSIEGVTIEGDVLTCTYASAMGVLEVHGTFRASRGVLDLVVEKVGSVTLERTWSADTGE